MSPKQPHLPQEREILKETLAAALALPAAERLPFIESATAAHPTLRHELSLLVKLSEEAGGFLQGPAFQLPTTGDLPDGTLVAGRYTILETLGRGASAVVYKASDHILHNKPVALKLLNHGVFDDAALRNEISALSRIDHPGIATVSDVGSLPDGRAYLVARFVPGQTLRSLFNSPAKLPPPSVAALARNLADALAAAHSAGVLHLDLRPENIIIQAPGTPSQQAVIVDFGVSARDGHAYPFTQMVRAGTYQAPELQDQRRSPAADFYSLGVILREALSGSPTGPVPRHWRTLLQSLTSPDPLRRLSSSSSVASALPRFGPRRAVVAAVTAAVAALAALYWTRPSAPPASPSLSIPVPVTTLPGAEEMPALSKDGKRLLFTWRRAGSESHDIWAIEGSAAQPRRLTSNPRLPSDLALSPDGLTAAFFRDLGAGKRVLMVMPSSGGPETALVQGYFNSVTWSTDGRSLAVAFPEVPGTPTRIHLLDIQSRQWRNLTNPPDGTRDYQPSFSPDGRHMAFVRWRKAEGARLHILPLTPGATPIPLAEPMLDIVSPVWASNQLVLFAAGTPANRRLCAISILPGSPVHHIDSAGGGIDRLSYSPLTRRLVIATSSVDNNIWRLHLSPDGDAVLSSTAVVTNSVSDEEPAISPDGKHLAFASSRTGNQQVWVTGPAGEDPLQVSDIPPNTDLTTFWSSDSQTVGYGFRWLRGVETHLNHLANLRYPSRLPFIGLGHILSRDGRFVYGFKAERNGFDGPLSRFPLAGGPPQELSHYHRATIRESADGQTIYFAAHMGARGIWSMPASGGTPVQVVDADLVRRVFTVSAKGIYFVTRKEDRQWLAFHPFATRQTKLIHPFPARVGFNMSITADGRFLYYTQEDSEVADIVAGTLQLP